MSRFWKAEAEVQLCPGLVPSEAVRETQFPAFPLASGSFWARLGVAASPHSLSASSHGVVSVCVQVFPFDKDTYNLLRVQN